MHASWTAKAFTSAGLLVVTVIVLAGVATVVGGEPPGWFFPVMFALFGGSVLAGAMGLLGLERALRLPAPRLARAGAVLAGVAGLGGSVWVGVALTGRPPWELGDAFYLVVLLGGFATFLASFLVFGIAILRTSVVPSAVGRLLVTGGLTFLLPVAATVVASDLIPFGVLGIWAVVFLGAGVLLRPVAPTGVPHAEVGEPSRP